MVAREAMSKAVERLFELAERHGYANDAALARALGVGRGTISRLRHGSRGVGLSLRIKVRRLFPQYDSGYLFPDEADSGNATAAQPREEVAV
jgi:hypothetical protein